MNSLLSEWKSRIYALKNVSENPEYTDHILKGRAEANRYIVGMMALCLAADAVTILLTAIGVIPIYDVLWTFLLLGGAFLCHLAAMFVAASSSISGRYTHYFLFAIVYLSCFFDGVWSNEYIVLLVVTPVMLSIRYYDVSFSCFVSVLSLSVYPVTHFCSALLWKDFYPACESFSDFLSMCFNYAFLTNILLIFLFCVAAVFSAVGGRLMILEEAEILSAQTKAELEATEAKTQIMLSQIQPHFIYNTLNTICYLCGKEPETAQNALSDFSDYLRENLNFSGNAELISFERELAHIEKYLSLEKLRFEDELTVETDIRCTSFRIPALSIQPLVENAVKHGICHRDGGGTVKIKTEETGEFYVITITDDGVGFDPEAPLSDNRRHIGLENTRSRLESMCGAKMELKSAVGEGTQITISVPKEFYYENPRG